MTKSQIEKFAVGYSSYPTDCVEEVLKITNFDEDVAREILDNKEKTLAIWQNGTIMIDGVTLCCGYDFAEDAFIFIRASKKNRKYVFFGFKDKRGIYFKRLQGGFSCFYGKQKTKKSNFARWCKKNKLWNV